MSIEQDIYDGNRAREILENEVFLKAFAVIEQELTDKWRDLPSTDETKAARDRLHLSLTMLHKLQNVLTTYLETGKLRTADLEHKRKLAERVSDAISSGFRQ